MFKLTQHSVDGTASYSLVSLLHQQENTLVECRFRMRFYLRLERLMTLGPKLDWCPWRFANLKMPPFTLLLQPAVQARQAEVEQRHDLSLFYSFFLNGCYRSLSYLYRMCHPYIMPPIRSLSMGYTVVHDSLVAATTDFVLFSLGRGRYDESAA